MTTRLPDAGRDRPDIRGVSSVAGNQTIEKTTRNALRICTLLGIRRHWPWALPGRCCPRRSPPRASTDRAGWTALPLPEPDREAAPRARRSRWPACCCAKRRAADHRGHGPLTNVAALLLAHPELKANIAGISLMGGGIAHGNWTPAAEFNILADPEAADVVPPGLPITMAGLMSRSRPCSYPEDFARIRAVGNPVAETVAGWLTSSLPSTAQRATPERRVHDAVACAPCCGLTCCTLRTGTSRWRRGARSCRGATVGDRRTAPNARVITGIDREGLRGTS